VPACRCRRFYREALDARIKAKGLDWTVGRSLGATQGEGEATSERRKPEPWQTNAPGPFLTIDTPRGPVALQSLGGDRFQLTGLSVEREITGLASARVAAHELAESVEPGEGR
jgi:hypothetical protein